MNQSGEFSKFAITLIAALCFCAPTLAFSDELDAIQRDRETAEMKYVNEIATGKYKTPTQQEELRKQILEPQEQRAQEYFKSISQTPKVVKTIKAEDIDLSKTPAKDLSQAAQNGAHEEKSNALRSAPAPQTTQGSDKPTLRPEFVLDGSNVPKEITFGVPDFESPQAAVKSSPSPKALSPSLKKK
jgi:hypothetical protein